MTEHDLEDNRITYRMYIEKLIGYERQHTDELFDAFKDLIAERVESTRLALRIQADEYERRLMHLNGQQSELATDRDRFYTKESFNVYQRDTDVRLRRVEEFVVNQTGANAGRTALIGSIVAFATLFIASTGIIVALLVN